MAPHTPHAAGLWWFQLAVTLTLAVAAGTYVRRWMSASPREAWRAASFLIGLLAIGIAAASPLASDHRERLTVHMVQHLLLMTMAAPLVLLGAPARRSAMERRLPYFLGRPLAGWMAGTMTLVGWHIPAAFTLGLRSEAWHILEQATFFAAGLLFWRPIVRTWPSAARPGHWWSVGYLFLATLPCDVLSAFLIFSERVAYPAYLSSGHDVASVVADQQRAGALMWTVVTLVYFIVGAVLATRLLTPGHSPLQRTPSRPDPCPVEVDCVSAVAAGADDVEHGGLDRRGRPA